MLVLVLLFALATGCGVLAGVVGTGSSLILLPVLVALYGPRVAVPLMGIASVMGNIGRVAAWWRRIRWRAVAAYGAPGVPAAALGAHTLLVIPPAAAQLGLAGLFVAMIPLGRVLRTKKVQFRLRHLAVAGAVVGFLTGLVLSTGPLSVPVFTGYGLSAGDFLGTEAASSLLLYAGKLATFGGAGALSWSIAARGVTVGTALLLGSLAARRIVTRLPARTFHVLIEGVLAVAAIGLVVDLI